MVFKRFVLIAIIYYLHIKIIYDLHELYIYVLFCSTTRETLGKRYCRFCSIYFATQAALKRHKQGKICLSLHEDISDYEDYQDMPADEISDELPQSSEPRTNLFQLFSEQFEEDD